MMNISQVKGHIFITVIVVITIILFSKTGVLYSVHYQILMCNYGVLLCKTAYDELER
jgi:hypothetical protein